MSDWRGQVRRYLDGYGMAVQDDVPGGPYDFVLTVPAYDEPADFLTPLLEKVRDRRVLTVVTVNVPDDAPAPARRRTRALAAALQHRDDVLLIERVNPPLPRRQGVGLARKLAADTAARLIIAGAVRCPWIFMTDADVRLPAGYFDALGQTGGPGTLLFRYRHVADDPDLARRSALYELHLRHYVLGLRVAGSPYAFHTLGSTIALHAGTYAAVRGMPRRNAAEDFYLLNKAAKVAPVFCAAEPRLTLLARPSNRVPFGTGPALHHLQDEPESYPSYPAAAFQDLAALLRALGAWASGRAPEPRLPRAARTALDGLGWDVARLAAYPPGRRRQRAVHEWFDGFRTMRFVRARTRALGATPLLDTLRGLWEMPDAGWQSLLDAARARDVTATLGVPGATGTFRTESG